KVESGKMDLNIQEVPVHDLAEEINRNFQIVAKEKGVNLEVSIDQNLPDMIKTDQQRLGQVLKNLLSNALKFTEKGTVSLSFSRNAGDQFIIRVSDTGIGIPKDKLDLIFEAFQQAEGGTSRKYGGTGLGLSISRELTKLLGGQLTVTSEPNKGSTFELTLPMLHSEIKMHVAPVSTYESSETYSNNVSEFLDFPTIKDQRSEIGQNDH